MDNYQILITPKEYAAICRLLSCAYPSTRCNVNKSGAWIDGERVLNSSSERFFFNWNKWVFATHLVSLVPKEQL